MRAVSARVARSDEDFEELWPIYVGSSDETRPVHSAVASTATFGLLLAMALLVGSFGISGPGGTLRSSTQPAWDNLRKFIGSGQSTSLREEFRGSLSGWTAPAQSDWVQLADAVRPGRLRIWSNTVKLTNYHLEFMGQIEHKGMSWAYRASDVDNYYATKIVLTSPGPLPSANLVRYAVVGGAVSKRASLPLPMTIKRDMLYRVLVNVKGDQFTTRINGQMVDTWSDARLKAGGVGFFAEKGESAAVRWVSVNNHEGVLGRVMSYLTIFVPPPVLP
ncbi:MAG: hypothetical protein HYZ57_00075 [Acidobacteria bacterium]|nr:hypothetical protein [Acidobacteriota bacterium]MBI3278218.1 hypothetical protein [Acidobacteriota bacterium]